MLTGKGLCEIFRTQQKSFKFGAMLYVGTTRGLKIRGFHHGIHDHPRHCVANTCARSHAGHGDQCLRCRVVLRL
jgi:hypothetical protein